MRSLRFRLIISHILPVLIILPVIGIGLVSLLRTQLLLADLSTNLINQASLVADTASISPEVWYDPGRAENFVNVISRSLPAQITLIDAEGRILATNNPAYTNQVGQALSISSSAKNGPVVEYSKSHQDEISNVTEPVVNPQMGFLGYVQLSNPFLTVDEGVQRVRQLTMLVIGAGLLGGLLLGGIFAVTLERPLRKATQAIYQLTYGQQMEPLKEQGPNEVRTLLRAFNTLVERLRSLEANRRQLLANLVHELGRPIGALQSAVQAMLGGAGEDPTLRKELLEGMGDELLRLRHLLDDLARLHDQVLGTLELNYQPLNLNEWLPRVLAPWRQAAQEKRQNWETSIQPDLPSVEVDSDRFAQALGNLVSNAIHYTPPGGTVSIDVQCVDGDIKVGVSDTGPGISDEEKARIFKPFYRGKAARRFSDGMGLGLTIAQDLVNAHGGRLVVESTSNKGSRFTIEIPVERTST